MSNTLGIIQPEGFPGLPEGWISDSETFPASDQTLQLFQAIHHPKDWKGHRALLVLHGLGEHGGRYLHVPFFVKDVVDAVFCLDQRGHGRAEGLRGHCDRFTQFTDDLALAINRIHQQLMERFGRAEVHVLGHSFGGLVALRTHFLNSNLPVKSVTVSSPLLGITVKIPPLKRLAGNVLSEVWGSLQMGNEINTAHLSHDPAVAVAYKKDRLVHDKVTPRLFTEMLAAMDDTLKRGSGFEYPLQMLVSLDDHVVDAEASQRLYRGLKIRDKQLKTYPGFFHEPFNEVEKHRAFEDLVTWIKKHSAS